MTNSQPCPDGPAVVRRKSKYPRRASKLTIRVYRVGVDGGRVPVSFRTSGPVLSPPLVSALSWPACGCPRCVGRGG